MEIIVTLTPEAAPEPLAAIGRPPEGAALSAVYRAPWRLLSSWS